VAVAERRRDVYVARKVKAEQEEEQSTSTEQEGQSTSTTEEESSTDTTTTEASSQDNESTDTDKKTEKSDGDPLKDLAGRVDELTNQVASLVNVGGGQMVDVRGAVAEALAGQRSEERLAALETEIAELKAGGGTSNGKPRSTLAAFILGNK
jgi:hypothetical protein